MLTKKEKWRLILGSASKQQLSSGEEESEDEGGAGSSSVHFRQMEEVLDYLYENEATSRAGGTTRDGLTAVDWINKVRNIFSKEVSEKIEKHAIEKYNLLDLLNDPDVLQNIEPNKDLLKNILQFKSHLSSEILEICKEIIRKVASDLEKKLLTEMKQSLIGKRNRNEKSNIKLYRNFDIKKTIRRNLKNYDPVKKKLVINDVYFNSNYIKQNTYRVIMAVDESGSMLDSVIYSAIVASIFSKIKNIDLKLVIFDTDVVDLSEYVEDPVEVMLKIQLGGGTYIDKAVNYCSKLVENPDKTIMILITDLFEGGSEHRLLNSIGSLVESGVKFITLTALDYDSKPYYDKMLAKRVSALGANVASMTPENLAEYVGDIINK